MKERITIVFGVFAAVLVLASLAIYVMFAGATGYTWMAVPTIAMILVALSAYILWDKSRSISRGLPATDARLRNTNYRAGYYAFIAAIWSAVGIPLFSDILFEYELEGGQITAAVVIVSGFVFAISYLYLARKGN